MTHVQLVQRAAAFARGTLRLNPVLVEPVNRSAETPDVIGFGFIPGSFRHRSVLIECKASRADFLRDKKKICRADNGLGTLRYYFAPPGIIRPTDLPCNWGLLEPHGRSVRCVVEAKHTGAPTTDATLLLSIVRRMMARGFDPNERLQTFIDRIKEKP